MKNKVIVLCFMSLVFTCHSQNLVRNHDFAHYNVCPKKINTRFKFKFLPDWSSPNLGTPDYFNICANPNRVTGIPNYLTNQEPLSVGYVGINRLNTKNGI